VEADGTDASVVADARSLEKKKDENLVVVFFLEKSRYQLFDNEQKNGPTSK